MYRAIYWASGKLPVSGYLAMVSLDINENAKNAPYKIIKVVKIDWNLFENFSIK